MKRSKEKCQILEHMSKKHEIFQAARDELEQPCSLSIDITGKFRFGLTTSWFQRARKEKKGGMIFIVQRFMILIKKKILLFYGYEGYESSSLLCFQCHLTLLFDLGGSIEQGFARHGSFSREFIGRL